MGNGALPHGPSDRAHPRLYRTCRPSMSALRPLPGAKRTLRGHRRMTASDPELTIGGEICCDAFLTNALRVGRFFLFKIAGLWPLLRLLYLYVIQTRYS